MKDFISLYEFLKSYNSNALSKQEVTELKKQYKKLYHAEYNRRRKKPITFTLRIKKQDYKRIKTMQKNLNYGSLNKFIITTLLAYIDKGYVYPQDESKQKLINEINAIGTNINQVVHKLHMHSLRMDANTETIDSSEENLSRILHGYKLLKITIDQLKVSIMDFINTPQPALLGIPWNELQQDKQKLQPLIHLLQKQLNSL